jgi:hypothetical protein
MLKNRKNLLSIVISMLLVIVMLMPTALAESLQSKISLDKEAQAVILNYYQKYYNALSKLVSPDFSNEVEINDSTYANIRNLDIKIAYMKEFEEKYSNIKVDIQYFDLEKKDNIYNCQIYVKAQYHQKGNRDGELSSEGKEINITLENINDRYLITSITPKNAEYDEYIYNVKLGKNKEACTTYIQAVDEYVNDSIAKMPEFKVQWDKWDEEYKKNYKSNEKKDIESQQNQNNIRSTSVSYYGSKAAAYGSYYGRMYNYPTFKRMSGGDCTNFVSQCIWAGYGGIDGFNLWNYDDIRDRVASDYRMVNVSGSSNDWWGANCYSSNTASSNWKRVVDLWDFVTSHPSKGPSAIGKNNNQYYWQYSGNLYRGNVFQFYHYSKGRYGHSVIMVSPNSTSYNNSSLNDIRVAQHSDQYSDRKLSDAIIANGGLGWGQTGVCKMRILKFVGAVFN